MCLTEFDEKKYEDVLREDGREEGRSEERKTLLEIVQKLKEGKTPEQLVADGMYVYGVNLSPKALIFQGYRALFFFKKFLIFFLKKT